MNQSIKNIFSIVLVAILSIVLSSCSPVGTTYNDNQGDTYSSTTYQTVYDFLSTAQGTEIDYSTSTPLPEFTSDLIFEPTENIQENVSLEVHITNNGHKYHRAGCRYLRQSDIPISLEDALSEGYGPCSICNPPTN